MAPKQSMKAARQLPAPLPKAPPRAATAQGSGRVKPAIAKAKAKGGSRAAKGAAAQLRQRSQADRRDLDAKVQRLLEDSGRLDHIPKSVWTLKENAKGQKLWGWAAESIQHLLSHQKLSSKWWAQTYNDFELHSWVDLEAPSADDEPSPELREVLTSTAKGRG